MQATAEKVQALVEQELQGLASAGRAVAGVSSEEASQRLIKPPRMIPVEVGAPLGVETVWLVLDERPDDEDGGYLVVYCSRRSKFGLAIKAQGESYATMIGFYGTLADTCASM
jgi:hypothetical protein